MSGKMSERDLEQSLTNMAAYWSSLSAGRISAHIAALTAERDEAMHRAKLAAGAHVEAVQRCEHNEDVVRALRERVKALEADLDDKRALAHKWKTSAKGLHGHLADIRQRAGEHATVGTIALNAMSLPDAEPADAGTAVARYILGEDAPAQTETPSERVTRLCAMEARIVGGMEAHHAEPTTAEAFAEVRSLVEDIDAGKAVGTNNVARALSALSLLERRMGAQERVVRGVLDIEAIQPDWLRALARSALTDVPPVSTVPAELATLIEGFADEVRRAEEHHAKKERVACLCPSMETSPAFRRLRSAACAGGPMR